MPAYPAEVAELVRAYGKDEEYKSHVRRQAHEIATHLLGARAMLVNAPYISVVADATYYFVTTILDRQTLGEEYVSTVQVTSDEPPYATPSIIRRLVDVAIHTAGPLVFNRLLARPTSDEPVASDGWRSWLRDNHATLARAHLGLFYVFAKYYHLSKRIAGVQHVSMRPQSDMQAARWFAYLGYATLIQCGISLAYDLHRRSLVANRKRQLDESPSTSDQSAPTQPVSHPCPLCLCDSSTMSMAQCGHVTCHECMHMQCVANAVCAECRQPIDEERCVPIFNL